MKKLVCTVATLLLAPCMSVFAEDGTARTTQTTTDAMGTTVTRETSDNLQKESSGAVKHSTETSTTVDPKGMYNKLKTERVDNVESKPNGDFKNETTIKHPDGTLEEAKAKRETSKHWLDSGKTTTTSRTTVTDPRGLGNKKTTEVTEKVDTNPNGTTSKTVTEKVNGNTTAETTVTHE